jgi:threonylcarbamoyladenosine tRNA methylthiotransferase MtaB
MPTVKFFTLGCKVNQYETQSIREKFLQKGFREVTGEAKADYYLVNTCTVTAVADQKSRSIIRNFIKANPKARVVVTGCMVKKDAPVLAQLKGVYLVIDKSFFSDGITGFSGHTRAFLKIQDGCNNSCSYCKVPLVRGGSRSRNIEEIVKEAEALARQGHREIVLTGICLGSYGRDFKPANALVDLLKELEALDGIYRIRLSSIEAKDVTDVLISFMAASKKLCRHLHIPIQSGDDKILKLMQRKNTRKGYIDLIKKIKSRIPGVGITTDVIVGFPSETDKAFGNTLRLLKTIQPLRVHVFPYSPRRGTRAYLMPGNISPDKLKKRAEEARSLAGELTEKYLKGLVGRKIEVLFESRAAKSPGFYEGYTDSYIKVLSDAAGIQANKVITLKVKSAAAGALVAGI